MHKKFQNDYYEPAEDTLFLADYIRKEKGNAALDVGTGSGFLAKILSKNFNLVVATDISFVALKKAHETIANCICCNAADAVKENFDLIVCNLPYLPSDELSDTTVDGLKEGVEIPSIIIRSASEKIRKNGKLVFLTSSLANYNKLVNLSESLGLDTKIVQKRKLFFEDLILVECLRK